MEAPIRSGRHVDDFVAELKDDKTESVDWLTPGSGRQIRANLDSSDRSHCLPARRDNKEASELCYPADSSSAATPCSGGTPQIVGGSRR